MGGSSPTPLQVLKYSKHCRACDKCVDVFDHCCRWLNNCVGRKNYKGFFVLMASALLLEREQATGDQESPQMSRVSSMTGLSRTSPFNAFHRGAWCTPPRSFPEEQFDVVHPNTITSVDYSSKKALVEESTIRRNVRAVKISPWTLARLNAEEVSKAAAQARRKSKILQPIVRWTNPGEQHESGSGRMVLKPDFCSRTDNRVRVSSVDLFHGPLANTSTATDNNGTDMATETSTSLAPLQLEARNAFGSNMQRSSARIPAAPNSSLDSLDLHPFSPVLVKS